MAAGTESAGAGAAPPDPAGMLRVRVVFALPDWQWDVALQVPPGTTAAEAVERSGLRRSVPQLAGAALDLGIFNRPCPGETRLRDGDRVEVYRPLLLDPKAARHLRVARKKHAAQAAAAKSRG